MPNYYNGGDECPNCGSGSCSRDCYFGREEMNTEWDRNDYSCDGSGEWSPSTIDYSPVLRGSILIIVAAVALALCYAWYL